MVLVLTMGQAISSAAKCVDCDETWERYSLSELDSEIWEHGRKSKHKPPSFVYKLSHGGHVIGRFLWRP
jgi:hypothetical protein